MAFVFLEADNLKRSTSFPVRVSRLYSCDWRRFRVSEQDHIYGQQEITLRYDSDSRLCMDKIDGQVMGIPFPNVVFKFPGMKIRIADNSPRSVIGFSYSSEVIELLRSWGMFPAEPFLPLHESVELKRLIGDFQKFTRIWPTLNYPGDWIDGIIRPSFKMTAVVSEVRSVEIAMPESTILSGVMRPLPTKAIV